MRLPDADDLGLLALRTGLELVLVRLPAMPPDARAPWLDVRDVERSGLRLVASEDGIQLWAVRLAPDEIAQTRASPP